MISTVLGDSKSESFPTISLDDSEKKTVNSFWRFSMYGAVFSVTDIAGGTNLNRPSSKLCLSGSWYNGSVWMVPVIKAAKVLSLLVPSSVLKIT